MSMWDEPIRRRLQRLDLEPTRAREIVEELSQHLHDRHAELREAGMSDAAARAEVLAELEAPGFLAERLTATEQLVDPNPVIAGSPRTSLIATLWQDLRYAIR